jgi:hypothetical protein
MFAEVMQLVDAMPHDMFLAVVVTATWLLHEVTA